MHDVVIIGAGPSGCTAASELVQAGAKVAIVDAQKFPRPKACGGGVLTRAMNVLPDAAAAAVQQRCSELEIHFYSPKLSFRTQRAEAFASVVTREELDAALLEALLAHSAQVDARLGQSLRSCSETDGGMTLELDNGERLQGRVVIAADGVHSHTAELAGFAPIPQLSLGVETDVPLSPAELTGRAATNRTIRFDFDVIPNGFGFVFPRHQSLSVGIIAGQADEAKLQAALRDFGERLTLPLRDSDTKRVAHVPVEPRPGPLARGRVLLVGDAAGFADPLTGEGLYFGALSARMAARAAAESGYEPERVGRAYQAELEAKILPELRLGRNVAKLFYGYPRFRNMLFRFAGQAACDVITEIALGEHSYGDYLGHGAASLSMPQLFKKLITTYEEDKRRA